MQNHDREDALKVTELTEQVTICYTLSPRWCVLRLAAGTGYWPPLTLAPGPRGLGTGAPLPARRHLTGASHPPLALLSTSTTCFNQTNHKCSHRDHRRKQVCNHYCESEVPI